MGKFKYENYRQKVSFTLKDISMFVLDNFCPEHNRSRFIDEIIHDWLLDSFSAWIKGIGPVYLREADCVYFVDENNEVIEELGQFGDIKSALEALLTKINTNNQ